MQQVIANELGVDINIIKMKSAMNVISPNATVTGGSFGSELNCAVSIFSTIAILYFVGPSVRQLHNYPKFYTVQVSTNSIGIIKNSVRVFKVLLEELSLFGELNKDDNIHK